VGRAKQKIKGREIPLISLVLLDLYFLNLQTSSFGIRVYLEFWIRVLIENQNLKSGLYNFGSLFEN